MFGFPAWSGGLIPVVAIVVLVTQPNGLPATWQWRYAGILSDESLAAELGGDILIQPDLAFAADGTPLALLTVATASGAFVGYDKNGCRAIELASIDPPLPKRGCDGSLIVRASLTGAQTSSCTYDPSALTRGIVFHAQTGDGDWLLFDSDLRP